MDSLYTIGVEQISTLQNVFANYSRPMINISRVFDPSYAFFFYTPVLFAFNFRYGKHILWTTVLNEWANQILKWLLFGERPYWWSLEHSNVDALPALKQFPVTCETGPGSPSGHAMITAAIFYIISDYLSSLRQTFVVPIWISYGLIVVSVSISRLYIAAHFPHQVVAGALVGVSIAHLVLKYRAKFEHASKSHYIWTSAFSFSCALVTYTSLNLLGFDADWSVKKAIQFCQRPEWIHLATSPLFTLMRYTGYLLGFGFFQHTKKFHFTLNMKFTTAVVSVVITKLTELLIAPPTSNVYMLYVFGFMMSGGLGYIYSAVAPWIATKIVGSTSSVS